MAIGPQQGVNAQQLYNSGVGSNSGGQAFDYNGRPVSLGQMQKPNSPLNMAGSTSNSQGMHGNLNPGPVGIGVQGMLDSTSDLRKSTQLIVIDNNELPGEIQLQSNKREQANISALIEAVSQAGVSFTGSLNDPKINESGEMSAEKENPERAADEGVSVGEENAERAVDKNKDLIASFSTEAFPESLNSDEPFPCGNKAVTFSSVEAFPANSEVADGFSINSKIVVMEETNDGPETFQDGESTSFSTSTSLSTRIESIQRRSLGRNFVRENRRSLSPKPIGSLSRDHRRATIESRLSKSAEEVMPFPVMSEINEIRGVALAELDPFDLTPALTSRAEREKIRSSSPPKRRAGSPVLKITPFSVPHYASPINPAPSSRGKRLPESIDSSSSSKSKTSPGRQSGSQSMDSPSEKLDFSRSSAVSEGLPVYECLDMKEFNLQSLDFEVIQSPIDFRFIKFLLVSNNQIKSIDFSILRLLKSIESVDLSNNLISEMKGQLPFTVIHLNIANNAISDLSCLAGAKIVDLNASGNHITDATGVPTDRLQRLDLSHNFIKSLINVRALALCHKLTDISLSKNSFVSNSNWRQQITSCIPSLESIEGIRLPRAKKSRGSTSPRRADSPNRHENKFQALRELALENSHTFTLSKSDQIALDKKRSGLYAQKLKWLDEQSKAKSDKEQKFLIETCPRELLTRKITNETMTGLAERLAVVHHALSTLKPPSELTPLIYPELKVKKVSLEAAAVVGRRLAMGKLGAGVGINTIMPQSRVSSPREADEKVIPSGSVSKTSSSPVRPGMASSKPKTSSSMHAKKMVLNPPGFVTPSPDTAPSSSSRTSLSPSPPSASTR